MKIHYEKVVNTSVIFMNNIGEPWASNQGEHYKLLTYITNQFDDINIIDVTTQKGLSALSLSQNLKNRVTTYDTEEKRIFFLNAMKNIKLKVLDISKESDEVIKSAKVIMLDFDAHDGIQERIFTDRLKEIGYDGYLICHGINLFAPMRVWWENIESERKYELTEVGNANGTGLVCYGNAEAEIIK